MSNKGAESDSKMHPTTVWVLDQIKWSLNKSLSCKSSKWSFNKRYVPLQCTSTFARWYGVQCQDASSDIMEFDSKTLKNMMWLLNKSPNHKSSMWLCNKLYITLQSKGTFASYSKEESKWFYKDAHTWEDYGLPLLKLGYQLLKLVAWPPHKKELWSLVMFES